MKNKKGQGNIALIIMVAIACIVGLIIIQLSAQYVGDSTTIHTWTEKTITLGSGTYTDIAGAQTLIGTYTLKNATNSTWLGSTINEANLSVVERVGDDGQKTLAIQIKDTRWASTNINISGDYGSDGYVESSGGRSVALVIVIFAALGVVVFALIPAARDLLTSGIDF